MITMILRDRDGIVQKLPSHERHAIDYTTGRPAAAFRRNGWPGLNYLDKIGAEVQRVADPDAVPPDEDLPLYRLYAVLLLAKGQDVTEEDVHNAWVAWASDHDPQSQHLKPFKELSLSVQRRDQQFAEAIRKVAKSLGIVPSGPLE